MSQDWANSSLPPTDSFLADTVELLRSQVLMNIRAHWLSAFHLFWHERRWGELCMCWFEQSSFTALRDTLAEADSQNDVPLFTPQLVYL